MSEISKQIGKLKKNLAFRYLGLTSLILVGSQLFFGIVQSRWNYTEKIASLEEKVEDAANFIGAVTQESGLKLDSPAFSQILRQNSIDTELVYSVVTNAKGEPVNSFLDRSLFEMTPNTQEIPPLNIMELIESVKQQGVREVRKPIFAANQYQGEIRLGYALKGTHQEIVLDTEMNFLTMLLWSSAIAAIVALLFEQQIYKPLRTLVREVHTTAGENLPPISEEECTNEIEQVQSILERMGRQLTQSESRQQNPLDAETHSDTQWPQDNIAKSQFLALIGHELRTPLNAVTGMTGLLMDTKLNVQQRDFVNIIRSSSENLLTMINNILDFGKIEANKLELEEQPFELGECIEEALRLFVPQASEKKLELAYLIEPQTPNAIVGDVTRLRQILVNLLGNAVKFTERGEVVVYVNATPIATDITSEYNVPIYEIRFAVKDTGIGIPTSRMDRLFKSFSQIDASTSRKYGGTGLGLAISKRLTELMGGKMWVHSVEGKGSTFYFTVTASSAPSSSLANSRTAEETLGGKRLLIVDDNVTNQKILTLQAQSWGMFTCAVDSGKRALEWLDRGLSFDVAILDMNMPQMNGLALAREIRQKPNFQDLPLIMLSSLGKPEISREVDPLKYAAILTKPIQQAQLYNVLVRILSERPIKVTQTSLLAESFNLSDSLPLRILVAEDVPVNQEVIRLQLEKLGYWSDIVSNGNEVLQALRRHSYDVILMDVRMPEMDGLTATRRIFQEWPPEMRPRIIAMTADAMQGDREKCLEVGMNDYIAKPIRLEDLRKTLSQCRPLPNEQDILNGKVLESLQKMAGKRANTVIPQLINSYLEDSPSRLEAIAGAIDSNDPETLRQAAHALRSASGQVGASQLAKLCQEIEILVRSGKLISISEKSVALKTEYERVCNALHRELDRIRTIHNN